MDIKLVRNFEAGSYSPVNRELLLQMINDNRQLDSFYGKKVFMFNPVTNERFEVLPEIPKFDLADIQFGTDEHDYIVFTSARMVNAQEIEIQYYWYGVADGTSMIMYTQKLPVNAIGKSIWLKTFVLDENYCMFQTAFSDAHDNSGNSAQHFELVLHDIKNEKSMTIENPLLTQTGVEKIIALDGNQCAIKIGSRMIGIINVKQFVSDLMLGLENVYIDVLDEGDEQVHLLYLSHYGANLIYSKLDKTNMSEDVIFYDIENKVKKVRLNSNVNDVSDLNHTYLIDGVPYMMKEAEKGTRFINLNTQKTEIKLGQEVTVCCVQDNLLVTQRHVKKMVFMRKENDFIEVFRFPNMHHAIFKTRGKLEGCVAHFDDLLIFTNGRANGNRKDN